MELMQTLRKIRACEGDAAAQLLLEAYVAQEVAAERERFAPLLREYMEIAYERREAWEVRDGDESDAMVAKWHRKIAELKAVIGA